MAKLTGPCLSVSASGKLANTMVFSTWKGLKYARQYIVPANPNTALQQTQRGYLTAALALYHDIVNVLNTLDKSNLDREAGIQAKPVSGFNQYVKHYIDTKVDGIVPVQLFGSGEDDYGAATSENHLHTAAATVNVKMRWGYSPTAMLNLVTRTEGAAAGTTHTFGFPALVAGNVIYYQHYDLTAGSFVKMGIGRFVVQI